MSTRHKLIALAVALALGAPAAAGAQALDFTYLEGGFIGSFANDVEVSGRITDNGAPLDLEADAGGGGFLGGAWQFGETMHLFGEYSSASQDLEVSNGINSVEGDFDLVRWRLGVGYAYPVSPTSVFYGRLSYDHAEFEDLEAAGFSLDADIDEGGVGGEAGMIWALKPTFHLQGHLRYTAVGDVANEGVDPFDSDILVGLNARWYFRPDIAVVTGYEFGKITTLNVGVRFAY